MKFPTYRILLFLLLLLIAHSLYAQKKNQIIVEQRNFSNFSQIIAKGISNVYLSQGNAFEVRVEAPEEMMDKIVIAQTGNQLLITTENVYEVISFPSKAMCNLKKSKILVTLPSLESIQTSGGASVFTNGVFKQENIRLVSSGTSYLKLNLDTKEVTCKINGGGKLKLSGNTNAIKANVSGTGYLNTYNLYTRNAQVEALGGGCARIFAVEHIQAFVGGTAKLRYKGNPDIANMSLSGGGHIRANN